MLIRGGRVIDPASGFDAISDVLLAEGRVAAIGQGVRQMAIRFSTLPAHLWCRSWSTCTRTPIGAVLF